MKWADGETTNNGNEKKKTISPLKYFTCIEIDYRKMIIESYEQFLKSYEQLMNSL